MMAFSASVVNLSRGFLGEIIGAFVNKYWLKIDETNVSTNYDLIIYLSMVMCVYELCAI